MNRTYVYLFEDMDSLPTNFADSYLPRLPLFRRKQCESLQNESAKNACVLAWLLLERGLREQYGVVRPSAFTYNKYGKPYLTDMPHIFFSLSHCAHGVVCALSNFETGIDIQDIQPFTIAVAQRVCTDKELRVLSECEDSARMFCRFWVKKESYAKAHGISVADVFKRELPDMGFILRESPCYCISLFQQPLLAEAEVNMIVCQLPL